MDVNTNKKIVFLTGSNGQLGKAISQKMSLEYEIYNLDISFTDQEVDSHHIKLDIAKVDEVKELYNQINPDILVNNAGISVFSSFLDRNSDELDRVFDVNLKGSINMINEFARINKNNKYKSPNQFKDL